LIGSIVVKYDVVRIGSKKITLQKRRLRGNGYQQEGKENLP
jgi:hypothetical protein